MSNQILNVDINSIRPDPAQPRKRFTQENLESLSKNIKIEGIINAIEVDKDMVIVTGETRWRAAKIAGLTQVPVKVIDVPTPELRFRRQFLENIHNDSMDIEETAKSMKRFLDLYYTPIREGDTGAEWLSKQIGKSRTFVQERLDYLKLSAPEKKAFRKKYTSLIKSYFTLDTSLKAGVMKKLESGEFRDRDAARRVISGLKTYPDYSDIILKQDFTGMSDYYVKLQLSKVIPSYSDAPFTDILREKISVVEEITGKAMRLHQVLKMHTISDIPNYQKARVASVLHLVNESIINFGKEKVLIED